MKKIINKIIPITVIALVTFFTSCEKDNYTNDSMMSPVSTTATITIPFPSVTLVEDGSSYTIQVALSTKQTVDVKLYVKAISGTASETSDYTMDHSIIIPAGSTTGSAKITIKRDDVYEPTETLKVQIGDATTANASVTPKTMDFTILNYTEGDLKIAYSWNPIAYNPLGEILTPVSIANMVLEIYKPDGSLLATVNGAGYESYVLSNAAADGVYTIKSSFYSAMDFGTTSIVMPQTLDFKQVGIFTQSFVYPDLAHVEDSKLCDLKYTMATVTKSGTNYTVNYTPAKLFALNPATFNGVFGGLDGSIGSGSAANWRFNNPVTVSDGGTKIVGLNVEWMTNVWGETVTSTTPVNIVFNNDGTLTIPAQPYMTTSYSGSPYSYTISGTGTWNSCNPKKMHIQYDMYNVTDDYSLGAWLKANNYSFTNYFIADLSL